MKDLLRRLPTTGFLIAFAFLSIRFLPLLYFSGLLFIVISLAVYEFIRLVEPRTFSLVLVFFNGLLVAAAFTFSGCPLLVALMAALIGNGLFFLLALRRSEQLLYFVRDIGIHFLTLGYLYLPLYFLLELKKLGGNYLFFLIGVIAIGDSGAYFVGSAIGKHKIYPVASPRKSWEGLGAAVVFAGLAGGLSPLVFPVSVTALKAIGSGALIGFVSQLSDPVESLFKRAASKKDSGGWLPGHGGILDRLDSYIFCAPVLFYLIEIFWK